jgi:hypothetical protein
MLPVEMGIDLDGEEPGEVSKYMVVVEGCGLWVWRSGTAFGYMFELAASRAEKLRCGYASGVVRVEV